MTTIDPQRTLFVTDDIAMRSLGEDEFTIGAVCFNVLQTLATSWSSFQPTAGPVMSKQQAETLAAAIRKLTPLSDYVRIVQGIEPTPKDHYVMEILCGQGSAERVKGFAQFLEGGAFRMVDERSPHILKLPSLPQSGK